MLSLRQKYSMVLIKLFKIHLDSSLHCFEIFSDTNCQVFFLPQSTFWSFFFFFFWQWEVGWAAPVVCGSSQARDLTQATAVTQVTAVTMPNTQHHATKRTPGASIKCACTHTHTHTHIHTRTHAHSLATGAFLSLSPCLTIFQSPVCGGGEGVCPSLTFSFPSSNSHPPVPQHCLKALEENCNSIVILYSHCYTVFRLMLWMGNCVIIATAGCRYASYLCRSFDGSQFPAD